MWTTIAALGGGCLLLFLIICVPALPAPKHADHPPLSSRTAVLLPIMAVLAFCGAYMFNMLASAG